MIFIHQKWFLMLISFLRMPVVWSIKRDASGKWIGRLGPWEITMLCLYGGLHALQCECGCESSSMLEPHPNMCFACGWEGQSSGMLVIWTQTQTMACDSWLVTDYYWHADTWTFMTLMIITCFGMDTDWWLNYWSVPSSFWCGQTLTPITICSYIAQLIMIDCGSLMDFYEICMDQLLGLP